jgi:hypothetical protein
MTEDAAACCVARSVTKRAKCRESGIAPVACAHCMCDDKPLMKCVACSVAHYCCKEHQLAHWPKHKAMCARFKKMTKEQLQQRVWQQHFSIMSLCAELHDLTSAKAPHASASATTPGHSDVMFLCSGNASSAAAEAALALQHVMGVGEHARECARVHRFAIARHCCGDRDWHQCVSYRRVRKDTEYISNRFGAGDDYLVRIPRNAFTVISPTGKCCLNDLSSILRLIPPFHSSIHSVA